MKMLLGGEWVERKKAIEVRDPYDDSLVDTVPRGTPADVEVAYRHALQGSEVARGMPVHQRAEVLATAAGIVKDRAEDFALTIAREGSKTIREARAEVARCINTLTISAEEAKRTLGETIPFDSVPGGENRRGYYYRFPVGVVLAITPFNDPLNLVAHKLGPALAGGNAVILKPATVTPLSALRLAEAFLEAGLPPSVLQVLTGFSGEVGDPLVEDPRARMISFTGGAEAGRRIARLAGLKKMGMELGSNSPVIVWSDADVAWAVESCVAGTFWAAGQNCLGVQRLYVHESVFDAFKEDFVERTARYRIGNKLREDTDMGPMITSGEAKRVESWIRHAEEKGARVLTGGGREGAVLEPTVLENVPETAKIHREEVFGPTVNLYPVSDFDDAVERANALPYGLQAAVFTKDVDLALRAAYALECGGVMINESTDYRLDSMPFGGVKLSGLGREGVKFALQEMTEPKVVSFYVRDSPPG